VRMMLKTVALTATADLSASRPSCSTCRSARRAVQSCPAQLAADGIVLHWVNSECPAIMTMILPNVLRDYLKLSIYAPLPRQITAAASLLYSRKKVLRLHHALWSTDHAKVYQHTLWKSAGCFRGPSDRGR